MNDGSPTLEVGFAINTGGSVDALMQVQRAMDTTEAKVIAEAAKITRATADMVSLGPATVQFTSFGNEATRALQNLANQKKTTEKAGEALIRQLERETAAFGKTRDEMRETRVAELALAASKQGNADLSTRLVAAEAALYDKRFAATRKARFEAEALAQAQEEAASQAVAAAERQAQALRSAAFAHDLFESAARRGIAAMREMEAAEKAAAATAEATRIREAAFAYGQFELAARRGAEALREVQAAENAAAADAEAQRLRDAAFAFDKFEVAARRGAIALREMQAAEAAANQESARLADSASRLRASIDPAYMAQQRFNGEMVEARSLIAANAITLDEYCAKLRIERAVLDQSSAAHGRGASSVGAQRAAMQGLGYQAQDTFTQISMGTNVLSVLAIQGGQAAGQIANLDGKLGKIGQFMLGPWGLALTAGMLVLGALTKGLLDNEEASKKAADGLKKFQDRQSDIGNFIDATTGRLVEQNKALVLNAVLTRQAQIADNNKQIAAARGKAFDRASDAALKNTTATPGTTTSGVSFGDNSAVQKVIKDAGGDVSKLAAGLAALSKTHPELVKVALDVSTIGGQAIVAQRDNAKLSKEIRGLNGDTNALGATTTAVIAKQVALATATTPLARARAELAIVEQGAAAADKAGGAALVKYRTDLIAATKAVNSAEAAQKSETAARRDANKAENLAERLGREAAAVEAQTKNLYSLADAYGVSGAAALVAEARLKAESQAIKQQADVDAAIARQVGLVIAQRVADAAKSTAAVQDQAEVQRQVNTEVAAGNVPAERAAELLRDRIADLPLLAAMEAAQQTKNADGYSKASDALDAQRAARAKLTDEERKAAIVAAMSSGANRLAELQEEFRLIGATDAVRVHALATLRATQEAEAKGWKDRKAADYIDQQIKIADMEFQRQLRANAYNDSLTYQADLLDLIASNAQSAAQGMADAFGSAGRALGDLISNFAGYVADRERLRVSHEEELKVIRQIADAKTRDQAEQRSNTLFSLRSSSQQIGAFGDMAASAKGFFKEGSSGYRALAVAEKTFRAIQFALSLRAMAQDAIETGTKLATGAARIAIGATEAVVNAIKSLPFPLNLAAGAATVAALASIGVSIAGSFGGGGKNTLPTSNTGTGTVLGDTSAKSDSIKNAIDALKEVDTVTNTFAREMAASLKSIDSQIGGVAALVVRSGNIDASAGVTEGFKANAIGSVLSNIPVIGGILGGLFGSKTSVIGSGLYGGAQSVGSILNGGFDASYYSDIEKKKKLFGITTGTKYSTQYSGADAGLENQFTLILKSFNDAIASAAGPLGVATGDVQARLNGFIVNIGKIDLKGLTGDEIEEKLSAVFGAAADGMAAAAFPGLEQFQKVGEGVFETLVRVASTVEAVGASLTLLGTNTQTMGIGVKLALADQFDSVSALTDAAGAYFETFYSKEEQAAAKTAQMNGVFASLGVAMPSTLAAFRQLVEAQDLTTTAGQSTYATLLKLAPAFADLQASLEGAKSAADIASERQDLQRQLLELAGDTAAIRALDLAKLDPTNRALQEQIYAVQDAQTAAAAAKTLADAWTSVGDSITAEIDRIRGLTGTDTSGGFASLLGQFNAANTAARGGDQDAAKSLPGLSQALLTAAAVSATSRQELDRIQAQTAASLEATNAAIKGLTGAVSPATSTTTSNIGFLDAAGLAQTAQTTTTAANDDLVEEVKALRAEIVQMRTDNNTGHATNASNTGRIARKFEDVTAASGGEAISVASAA